MTTSKATASTTSKSQTESATKMDQAKAQLDTVKNSIPSMNDAQSFVQEHMNMDVQKLSDDATAFVRRNPGTSLAAAAGLGILIGVLAAKRS